jgi:hypothetical protein
MGTSGTNSTYTRLYMAFRRGQAPAELSKNAFIYVSYPSISAIVG